MKALTDGECLEWLSRHGLPVPHNATAEDFFGSIPFREFACLKFTLPKDSGQKVSLARSLFQQMKPESSLLLWIRNWMVWPSSAHIPLVVRLRQSLGCERSLGDAPGHVFEPEEAQDAISILILSFQFFWDCLLVDGNRRLVAFASHDEYLLLMSGDRVFLDQVGGILEAARWCQAIR